MKHRIMLAATTIGLLMWALPIASKFLSPQADSSFVPGWWALFPSLEVGIITSFFAARRWEKLSGRGRAIVLYWVPYLSTTAFLWFDYCKWLQKVHHTRFGTPLSFVQSMVEGLPALPLTALLLLLAGVLWCPLGVFLVRRLGLASKETARA